MWLLLRKDVDEFLEISDTSASKKLGQPFVAVTWLYNVDKMFSLRPRDTSGISKLSDKPDIIDDTIQHFTTIDSQYTNPNFVQRPNVTELSSYICS